MSKVIAETEKAIAKLEKELCRLREQFDEAQGNDTHSQVVVAQHITEKLRELEMLERFLTKYRE